MTAAPLAGALVDATALRDSTLFAGFDDSQCRRIGEACRELDVDAGTTPTEQGENGYALFASSRERPPGDAVHVHGELARLDRDVPALADALRKVGAERLERDCR